MYRNVRGSQNNWVELDLQGVKSNRDAIGTRVSFYTPTGLFYRETNAGNGFESQSTSRVHVGTGKLTRIDCMVVEWSSGRYRNSSRLPPENAIASSKARI